MELGRLVKEIEVTNSPYYFDMNTYIPFTIRNEVSILIMPEDLVIRKKVWDDIFWSIMRSVNPIILNNLI